MRKVISFIWIVLLITTAIISPLATTKNLKSPINNIESSSTNSTNAPPETSYGNPIDDADPDSDSLTNAEEKLNGTNPFVADTDGDGINDGWEVRHLLNPLDYRDAHSWDLDDDNELDRPGEDVYGDGMLHYNDVDSRPQNLSVDYKAMLGTDNRKWAIYVPSDETRASYEKGKGDGYIFNDTDRDTVGDTVAYKLRPWNKPDPSSGRYGPSHDKAYPRLIMDNIMEYVLGCDPLNVDTDNDWVVDTRDNKFNMSTNFSKELFRAYVDPQNPDKGGKLWRETTYDLYTGPDWGHSENIWVSQNYRCGDNITVSVTNDTNKQIYAYDIKFNLSQYQLAYALYTKRIEVTNPNTVKNLLNYPPGDFFSNVGVNNYTLTVETYNFTEEQLKAGTVPNKTSSALSNYFQLPKTITPRTIELAMNITKDCTSPYEKATAIMKYITSNYELNYTAPIDTVSDMVDWFLFESINQMESSTDKWKGSGTILYMSSAFVVLARLNNIPARLVYGYQEGLPYTKDEEMASQLSDVAYWGVNDSHRFIWADVYFNGMGWIEFVPEQAPPTVGPGRGGGGGGGGGGGDVIVFWADPNGPPHNINGTYNGSMRGSINGELNASVIGLLKGSVNASFDGRVSLNSMNITINGTANGYLNVTFVPIPPANLTTNLTNETNETSLINENINVNASLDGAINGTIENGTMSNTLVNGTIQLRVNGTMIGYFNGAYYFMDDENKFSAIVLNEPDAIKLPMNVTSYFHISETTGAIVDQVNLTRPYMLPSDGVFAGQVYVVIDGNNIAGTIVGKIRGLVRLNYTGDFNGNFDGKLFTYMGGVLIGTLNNTHIEGYVFGNPSVFTINKFDFVGARIEGSVNGSLSKTNFLGIINGSVNSTFDGVIDATINGTMDGKLINGTFDTSRPNLPNYWYVTSFDEYIGQYNTSILSYYDDINVMYCPGESLPPLYEYNISDVVNITVNYSATGGFEVSPYGASFNNSTGLLPVSPATMSISSMGPLTNNTTITFNFIASSFYVNSSIDNYSIKARLYNFTNETFNKSLVVGSSVYPQYYQLPGYYTNITNPNYSKAQNVRDLAKSIVGNEESPYKKANLIMDHLKSGAYTYLYNASAAPAGNDSVEWFLFNNKTGNYTHFAQAFVILCRLSNIPARYAVGYKQTQVGNGTRVFRENNTYAWGEVLFENIGWLEFDITENMYIPDNTSKELFRTSVLNRTEIESSTALNLWRVTTYTNYSGENWSIDENSTTNPIIVNYTLPLPLIITSSISKYDGSVWLHDENLTHLVYPINNSLPPTIIPAIPVYNGSNFEANIRFNDVGAIVAHTGMMDYFYVGDPGEPFEKRYNDEVGDVAKNNVLPPRDGRWYEGQNSTDITSVKTNISKHQYLYNVTTGNFIWEEEFPPENETNETSEVPTAQYNLTFTIITRGPIVNISDTTMLSFSELFDWRYNEHQTANFSYNDSTDDVISEISRENRSERNIDIVNISVMRDSKNITFQMCVNGTILISPSHQYTFNITDTSSSYSITYSNGTCNFINNSKNNLTHDILNNIAAASIAGNTIVITFPQTLLDITNFDIYGCAENLTGRKIDTAGNLTGYSPRENATLFMYSILFKIGNTDALDYVLNFTNDNLTLMYLGNNTSIDIWNITYCEIFENIMSITIPLSVRGNTSTEVENLMNYFHVPLNKYGQPDTGFDFSVNTIKGNKSLGEDVYSDEAGKRGTLLPAVLYPTGVKDVLTPFVTVNYARARETFFVNRTIEQFNFTSTSNSYTLEQLYNASVVNSSEYPNYYRLPNTISNRTIALVMNITKNETSPHKKAVMISNYLLANYDLNATSEQAPDGNDTVDYFLFDKTEGTYAEFGAAFLVLCRLSNIPARYTLSYKLGVELLNGTYVVHGSDATVIGEVLYNDIGWAQYDLVPFPYALPTRINITYKPDTIYNGVPFTINATVEFFANGIWTPSGNTIICATLGNSVMEYPLLDSHYKATNRTTDKTGFMSEQFMAPGLLPGGLVDVVVQVVGPIKYGESTTTPKWGIENETERNATDWIIYNRTTLLELDTNDSVINGDSFTILGSLVADQGNNMTEFDMANWKMNYDLWLDNKNIEIYWNGSIIGNIPTSYGKNGAYTMENYVVNFAALIAKINEKAGEYNLTVRFVGDTYNKSSSVTKMIKVMHRLQIDVNVRDSIVAGETLQVTGSILRDDDGNLVNFGDQSLPTGGATLYNKTSGGWINYTTDNGLLENDITTIAVDGDWVWFGTSNGLCSYNKISGEFINYTSPTDLPSMVITSIVVDENIVWVGTNNGIAKYNKSGGAWEVPGWPSWSVGNFVSSMVLDGDTIWFGTNNGIVEYNKKVNDGNYTLSQIYSNISGSRVSSIGIDGENIWFGTDNGISVYNKPSKITTNYTLSSGLSSSQISAIVVDGTSVWFGTAEYWNDTAYTGGGISVFDKTTSTWTIYNISTGLVSNNITCAMLDDNVIWFGTARGINCYDKTTREWHLYTVQSGLASNNTLSMAVDGNNIWFGTRFIGLKQIELSVEYYIDNTTQLQGFRETHLKGKADIRWNKFAFEYEFSKTVPAGDYSIIVVSPRVGYYLETAYQWIIKVRQTTSITMESITPVYRGDKLEIHGILTSRDIPLGTKIGGEGFTLRSIAVYKTTVLNPPSTHTFTYSVRCVWNIGTNISYAYIENNDAFTLILQIPHNQIVGNYTANITFDETCYYLTSSIAFNYTVLARTKMETDTKIIHRNTNFTITGSLLEKNSTTPYVDTPIYEPLAGEEVVVDWNSSSIGNVITSRNGTYTANYSIGMSEPLGRVNVSSKFDATEFYNGSDTQVYYYIVSDTMVFNMRILPTSENITNEVIKGTNTTVVGQLLDDWNHSIGNGVIELYWNNMWLARMLTNNTGHFNYTFEAYNITGSIVAKGRNKITANFVGIYVYEYMNNLTKNSVYQLAPNATNRNYTFIGKKIQSYMDTNATLYVPYIPCSNDIIANVTTRTGILVWNKDTAIRKYEFAVNGQLYEDYGSYGHGGGAPNQDISITFTNGVYTVKTDAIGRFTASIQIANTTRLGKSNIGVIFIGNYNEYLKPSRAPSNITIVSNTILTILKSPREVVYGEGFTVVASLTYDDGITPVKNETISMTLSNGKDVRITENITTDGTGKAYYNGSISSDAEKPLIIDFSFAGDPSSHAETSFSDKRIQYTIPLWIKLLKNILTIFGVIILIFAPIGVGVAYFSYRRRQEIEGLKYIIKRTTKQLIAGNEYVATIFKLYRKLGHHLKKFGYLRKEGETFREFESALRIAIPYINTRQFSLFISILEESMYSSHKITPRHQSMAINCLRDIEASLSRYGKLEKVDEAYVGEEWILTTAAEKKPAPPVAKVFTVKKLEPIMAPGVEEKARKVKRKVKEKEATVLVRARPSDIKPMPVVSLKPVMTLRVKEREVVRIGEMPAVKEVAEGKKAEAAARIGGKLEEKAVERREETPKKKGLVLVRIRKGKGREVGKGAGIEAATTKEEIGIKPEEAEKKEELPKERIPETPKDEVKKEETMLKEPKEKEEGKETREEREKEKKEEKGEKKDWTTPMLKAEESLKESRKVKKKKEKVF